MTRAFNMDCMKALREFPDNFFDLAVVDPPYGDASSQNGNVERERERAGTGSADGSIVTSRSPAQLPTCQRERERDVARTGGTWAEKFGKKLLRGTRPRKENILFNSFVSHAIKSFGAGIILNFLRPGALLSGEKQTFRKISQWLWLNMRGRVSTITRRSLTSRLLVSKDDFIRHKSPWICIVGYTRNTRNPVSRFSTRISAPAAHA